MFFSYKQKHIRERKRSFDKLRRKKIEKKKKKKRNHVENSQAPPKEYE